MEHSNGESHPKSPFEVPWVTRDPQSSAMTRWGLWPPWQNGNLHIALGRLHRCAQSPIFNRKFIHKWAVATTSMSMWGYGNSGIHGPFMDECPIYGSMSYFMAHSTIYLVLKLLIFFPGTHYGTQEIRVFLRPVAKCRDFTCDLISVLTSFPSGGLPQSSSRHEHWNMETTMKQPWWRLGIPLCYLILRTPPMYSQMIRWS
jgi:hypothetical protein